MGQKFGFAEKTIYLCTEKRTTPINPIILIHIETMKPLFPLFSFLALFVTSVVAQNPYLPLWEFIPDGEPYVFEDPDQPGQYRVYIYGSHDNLVTMYCGLDQVVWSAPVDDLRHWRYDGVIFESKKDARGNNLHPDGKGDVLFAPDVNEVIAKDGTKTYYLYPNNQAGGRQTMVAKSSRPDGPFEVCNWSPDNPKQTVGILGFDPAVFTDTDGRTYAYWGFEQSNGAELDPTTMATVKPGTKIVENMIPSSKQDHTYRFFEASSMRKIEDKYVFVYSRVTNDGEDGLHSCNYTLAYCYGNHPLGPWTYGGTIIDGRGKEHRPNGTTVATATPFGNTHGSICKIGDQWYVFYHRQAGTNEYGRQAMVAPIRVEVVPGEDGYVRISEAEFTSEGFLLDGLDPYETYSAGIACYYMGPEPATQDYPNVNYPGSHTQIVRGQYQGTTDLYDLSVNRCPMVNNTAGSVVGYKYYNFSKTFGQTGLKLALDYTPDGVAGRIDIFLDRPSEAEGGVRLGSINVSAEGIGQPATAIVEVEQLKYYNGKHALFFVFDAAMPKQSICQLNYLHFVKD